MDYSELHFLRAAACSPAVTVGDPQANIRAIQECVSQLVEQGASIVTCPELSLSGYSAEDLFFTQGLLDGCVDGLLELVQNNTAPLLAVGTPWQLPDGRLLNCAAIVSHQRLLGLVPKTVHPNYGEFYDQRWFVPGGAVNEAVMHARFGRFDIRTDQLFRLGEYLIGVEICEDLWAPISPSTEASLAGAQIILNLSASNELISKADYRRDLVRMASAKNICAYVYAGAHSMESTKDVVFGGHCMIYENGTLLGRE